LEGIVRDALKFWVIGTVPVRGDADARVHRPVRAGEARLYGSGAMMGSASQDNLGREE
jgi:hypothetical protein